MPRFDQDPLLDGTYRINLSEAQEPVGETRSITATEPLMPFPETDNSFVIRTPEGLRFNQSVDDFSAQQAAYLRSLQAFPGQGSAAKFDFLERSYVLPNEAGDPTPTPFDAALTINRSTEALTIDSLDRYKRVAMDEPRIAFDDGLAAGILLEPARTNFVPSDLGTWTVGPDATITEIVDEEARNLYLDGDAGRAWRVTFTGDDLSTAYIIAPSPPIPVTQERAYSIHMKYDAGAANPLQRIDISFNAPSSDPFTNNGQFDLTTGTQRFRGLVNDGPGGFFRGSIVSGANLNNDRFLIRGRDAVAGQTRSVILTAPQAENIVRRATSAIPPDIGNRGSDNLTINKSALLKFLRPEQGAIYVEVESSAELDPDGHLLFSFAGIGDNNQISMAVTDTGLRGLIRKSSITTFDQTLPVTAEGQVSKCLLSYGPSGIILARNGTSQSFAPADLPEGTTYERGLIGDGLPTFSGMIGYMRRIVYYPMEQDSAFAQQITTV